MCNELQRQLPALDVKRDRRGRARMQVPCHQKQLVDGIMPKDLASLVTDRRFKLYATCMPERVWLPCWFDWGVLCVRGRAFCSIETFASPTPVPRDRSSQKTMRLLRLCAFGHGLCCPLRGWKL